MIPKKDYNKILRNFPNVELSYEKNFYKKVLTSNIYITIPKGRKYFAWFYRYKGENVCILLLLSKKKGKEKYLKYFNSTEVAKYIISKTFEIKNKKNNFYWEKV